MSLSAEYNAPSSEKKISHPLPSISEKTAYLTALRTAITDTQDQVNVFLTQKMDEDNKKAGVTAPVDDAKAEENYGEEVIDGED